MEFARSAKRSEFQYDVGVRSFLVCGPKDETARFYPVLHRGRERSSEEPRFGESVNSPAWDHVPADLDYERDLDKVYGGSGGN